MEFPDGLLAEVEPIRGSQKFRECKVEIGNLYAPGLGIRNSS
jgi:hypothetical protein